MPSSLHTRTSDIQPRRCSSPCSALHLPLSHSKTSHPTRNAVTHLVCNLRFSTCLSTLPFSFNPKWCRLLHAPTVHSGWVSRWVKLNSIVSNIRNQSSYFQTLQTHYKCNEFSFLFWVGVVKGEELLCSLNSIFHCSRIGADFESSNISKLTFHNRYACDKIK